MVNNLMVRAKVIGLKRILIAVRARNQKYEKSYTFSITADVPKKNSVDDLPY